MATEGVERIQMGEAEAEIMKRAQMAGEQAANANKQTEENKKRARTLDLSIFDNNVFSDLDDDVFDAQSAQQSLMDKKGTALYNETIKICSAQIPAQCKSYGSMLSLVYAQKIKSDCIAYENSLKAQRSQSQQKLQTAQKALRDAALDEYKNQNKYATTGECVIAFTECMKTTAECGEDYTGCVTLAANENVKNNKKGSVAKQSKIKGSRGGADITLAASTMEQLLAKKMICERITKQCVNSNKNDAVWNGFLRNAAPAIKSAELIAEQNLRSNCIPTLAKCFQNACKSNFGDTDSYDMCLSNPETYKSLCKVQLEPCLEATGGDYNNPTKSTLWNGLLAMLGAMKVDACTTEVKACLTERCGDDYSGCIGLDTESIGDICPYQKLTACMSADENGKPKYDKDTVKEYVVQIAQGLAIQIDNALATACQNAANEAMVKICGDTETCDAATFDLSSLERDISVQICPNGKPGNDCKSGLAMMTTNDLKSGNYQATLVGTPDIYKVSYDYTEDNNGRREVKFSGDDKVSPILDNALNRIMASITTDPKVVYCTTGRQVEGFDGKKFGSKEAGKARFPNLTDSYRSVIADSLLNRLSEKNAELTSKYTQQIADLDNQIAEMIYADNEDTQDENNKETCENKTEKDQNWRSEGKCSDNKKSIACKKIKQLTDKIATYDSATNICTITTTKYSCTNFRHRMFGGYCDEFDDGTVLNTETVQMGKSH